MKQSKKKSASGLRTWLPEDVEKQNYITDKLVELYKTWGYQPIIIPTLVDMDVLKQANVEFRAKTFKVVDKDGELLALRPELTPSIAKAVSSRYNELKLPLRLYYNSTVFRHSGKATDDTRELLQAGIELIGTKAIHNFSNSEILHLVTESVAQFGVKGWKLVITHSSIWQKVLNDYPDIGQKVYEALNAGNLVVFDKLVDKKHPLRVLVNSNDIEEVEKVLKLDLSLLKEIGIQENSSVVFDPSLCPDLDYYTGIYFNLLVQGCGDVVAIGGRYDNLYKSFGVDLPAIGFAYYVQSFLTVLQEQELFPKVETDHASIDPQKSWSETLELAKKEIAKGKRVRLNLNN